MIHVTKNATNYLVCTLSEISTLSSTTIHYLVSLESQNSNQSYTLICPDVSTATVRYNKLVLIDNIVENLTGGTINLPVGEYIYKIYEQTSPTNLDVSNTTSLLERGLLFVTDNQVVVNFIDDNENIYFKIRE